MLIIGKKKHGHISFNQQTEQNLPGLLGVINFLRTTFSEQLCQKLKEFRVTKSK